MIISIAYECFNGVVVDVSYQQSKLHYATLIESVGKEFDGWQFEFAIRFQCVMQVCSFHKVLVVGSIVWACLCAFHLLGISVTTSK